MATSQSSINIIIDAENKTSSAFLALEKNLDKVKTKLEEMKPVFQKMAVVGTAVFGAVTAEVGLAIKAYADSEVAMARINSTLETMGDKGLKAKDAILEMAKAAVKLGFDDEDAAESIAKFYKATGDLEKAQKMTTIAMDVARGKNIELSESTRIVTLMMAGNTKEVKALGFAVDDAKTPFENLTVVQNAYAGQAIKFADTFEGKMQILGKEMGNIQESIGKPFVDMLSKIATKLEPILSKVGDWIEANPNLTAGILIAVGAIGGLVGAIGLVGMALPGIIVMVNSFGASMAFVGTTILPITAIVAGFIWIIYNLNESIKIWQNDSALVILGVKAYWEDFKNFFIGLWDGIKKYFSDVWDGMKIIFQDAVDWVTQKLEPLFNLLDKAKNKIASIKDAVSNTVSNAVNYVTGRATGGPVGAGEPHLVGENGPELFIPSSYGRISPNFAGGGGLNIYVTGNSFMGKEGVAEMIGDELARILKNNRKF